MRRFFDFGYACAQNDAPLVHKEEPFAPDRQKNSAGENSGAVICLLN